MSSSSKQNYGRPRIKSTVSHGIYLIEETTQLPVAL